MALPCWMARGAAMGAIALVALLALGSSAEAGSACRGEPVTTGDGPVVHMSAVCFSPTMVHVDVGTTVTWLNDQSDLPHAVTGANASWGSFEELAPNGESWSFEFAKEGMYPYYCVLHPGMIGAVIVGETPPASVSRTGGVSTNDASRAEAVNRSGSGRVLPFVVLAMAVGGVATLGGFALGARRARC